MLVITGYSNKEDGILIVSESLKSAAASLGMKIHKVVHGLAFPHIYFTNRDEPNIHEEEAGWGTWSIENCEFQTDVNLTEAMQW